MRFTKEEKSWIAYDMGNSAYTMAITSALLPLYFGMFHQGNQMDLGYFNSIASLLVAVLSPVLGTIADFQGYKKRFFIFFSLLGIFSTAALALVPYYWWQWLMVFFILSCIGFAGSNIFYDSFLTDVTEEQRWDGVSSAGYAYGYIASVLPFALCLVIVGGIGLDQFIGYQISFVLTAAWWLIFTIPMYRNVHQTHYMPRVKRPVRTSFKRLAQTFRHLRRYRTAMWFLFAYFLYIDGVDTIIKMVVPYAQGVLNMEQLDTMLMLGIFLLVQIIAFPFALLYGRWATKRGAMPLIRIAIITYIVSVFAASAMTEVWHIFILGTLIGSAQGGIQALSRSYFARLIPKNASNEFFGFYNIFGKFAAIFGPLLMSLITQITGEVRLSIYGILPLFVLGLIVTFFLPTHPAGVQEEDVLDGAQA